MSPNVTLLDLANGESLEDSNEFLSKKPSKPKMTRGRSLNDEILDTSFIKEVRSSQVKSSRRGTHGDGKYGLRHARGRGSTSADNLLDVKSHSASSLSTGSKPDVDDLLLAALKKTGLLRVLGNADVSAKKNRRDTGVMARNRTSDNGSRKSSGSSGLRRSSSGGDLESEKGPSRAGGMVEQRKRSLSAKRRKNRRSASLRLEESNEVKVSTHGESNGRAALDLPMFSQRPVVVSQLSVSMHDAKSKQKKLNPSLSISMHGGLTSHGRRRSVRSLSLGELEPTCQERRSSRSKSPSAEIGDVKVRSRLKKRDTSKPKHPKSLISVSQSETSPSLKGLEGPREGPSKDDGSSGSRRKKRDSSKVQVPKSIRSFFSRSHSSSSLNGFESTKSDPIDDDGSPGTRQKTRDGSKVRLPQSMRSLFSRSLSASSLERSEKAAKADTTKVKRRPSRLLPPPRDDLGNDNGGSKLTKLKKMSRSLSPSELGAVDMKTSLNNDENGALTSGRLASSRRHGQQRSKSPTTSSGTGVVVRHHIAAHRNPLLAELAAEYEDEDAKKQAQGIAHSNRCDALRKEMEKYRAEWMQIKLSTDEDLRQMRQEFLEQRDNAHDKITKAFSKQLEEEDTMVEQHLKRQKVANEQTILELSNEQANLQAEIKDIQAMMEDVKLSNHDLEQANDSIQKNFVSLTQWCQKKEMEQDKLKSAHDRMGQIYRGSCALLVEPTLKKIYRSYMYKVGHRTKFCHGEKLFHNIMGQITECENGLGEEALDASAVEQETFFVDANFLPRGLAPVIETSERSEELTYMAEDVSESSSSDGKNEYEFVDVTAFTKEAEAENAAMMKLAGVANASQISTLQQNKDMLLTIFKFLDTDGSGSIDPEEFRVGVDLLNKRIPGGAKFNDPDKIFHALDVDGSGTIDIDEFNSLF